MTKRKYKFRLKELVRLLETDPMPSTPKGRRIKSLARMLERYEKQRFPALNDAKRLRAIGGIYDRSAVADN